MICPHCGIEYQQQYDQCPNCGSPLQPSGVPTQGAGDRLLAVLKDQLFLILCILVSISCVTALSAGDLPLINILITIFLWLTYAQAAKGIPSAEHLRCVSGSIYAQYVIIYVSAVLTFVVGLVFAVFFGHFAKDPEYLRTILSGFVEIPAESWDFIGSLAAVSGAVVLVACLLAAIIMVLVNIFSLRYIHRFAQSFYRSIESGVLELKCVRPAYIWLIIFSVFSGISTLSALGDGQFFSLISNGASCGTTVIAALLIRKYLQEEL